MTKCCNSTPRLMITITWFLASILVLVAFIVGAVVASELPGGRDSGALQFAAVFSTLLYMFVTVVGTLILRKYKTPLAIGVFIGFVFALANLCLILSAIFGNLADVVDDDDESRPYEAFTVFQFFLFIVYSIFGTMLCVFRSDLILIGQQMQYDQDSISAPPPAAI